MPKPLIDHAGFAASRRHGHSPFDRSTRAADDGQMNYLPDIHDLTGDPWLDAELRAHGKRASTKPSATLVNEALERVAAQIANIPDAPTLPPEWHDPEIHGPWEAQGATDAVKEQAYEVAREVIMNSTQEDFDKVLSDHSKR